MEFIKLIVYFGKSFYVLKALSHFEYFLFLGVVIAGCFNLFFYLKIPGNLHLTQYLTRKLEKNTAG